MNRNRNIPPRLATRFLRAFLRDDLLEDVVGDLQENFDYDIRTGSLQGAKIKYWKQVLLYFRPFAVKKFRWVFNNSVMMYRSYFRVAAKKMAKDKPHSLINVSGLAIGMAIAIIIGLWIRDEISYNTQFANFDRIGQVIQNVTNNGEVETWQPVPWPLGEEIRENYGADFERVAMATGEWDHTITVGGSKYSRSGIFAEADFLKMFDVQLVRGTFPKDDASSLLLSASTAKAFFGEMDPLGQMVEMDGGIVFHVVGVYRDFPSRSSWNNVRFLGQWAMYATVSELDKMEDPWRPNAFQLFVMLRDNASFSDASRRIKDAKLKRLNEALAKKKPVLFIHPMKDWYLRSEFRNGKQAGGRIQYVWMFGIVGVFVLLMACINFMNLSTARSEKRAKEVGIRKAVGSYRSQLVTQFFSESLFTTFIALVFAIVLAHLTIPLFNTMSEKAMTLPWDDPDLWFVAVVSALLIGIVAGSYPALYLSGIRPVRALKGTFKSGRNASAARRVLVVLQFGVSVIMIIGTSTVFLQIQHGKNRPLGFNVNGLISIPTTTREVHQHFDVIRKSLLDDAWIVEMAESVAPATEGWSSSSRIEWNGKDPDIAVDFNIFEGSFEYGRTLQWEVLQGRDFSRDFPSDSSAVIMNEAAAGYLNKHNVVGELLRVNGQACTIIGVVKDVVFGDPYQPVRPSLYFVSQRIEHFLTLRLNPSKPAAASLAAIEQVIKPHLKGEPFQYQFLDADQALKFADEERVGVLAGAFTGLAIFISCLGIFGLSSFVAEQRTKEIGLRKVLGANFTQVWMLISMDFLVLVLISCLIAAPVAVWLLRSWLEGYEYRVALPYWVFLVTAVATLVITIITISGHVIRAARLNPAQTLKVE